MSPKRPEVGTNWAQFQARLNRRGAGKSRAVAEAAEFAVDHGEVVAYSYANVPGWPTALLRKQADGTILYTPWEPA